MGGCFLRIIKPNSMVYNEMRTGRMSKKIRSNYFLLDKQNMADVVFYWFSLFDMKICILVNK